MTTTTKKLSFMLGLVIAIGGFLAIGTAPIALASSTFVPCTVAGSTMSQTTVHQYVQSGDIKISFATNGNKVTGTIQNNTLCTFNASQMSYSIFDQHLNDQVFYSGSSVEAVPAKSTKIFTTSIPSCMAQTDIYYGQGLTHLTDSLSSASWSVNPTLLGTINGSTGKTWSDAAGDFCNNTPPPAPTLNAFCSDTTNTAVTISWKDLGATAGSQGYDINITDSGDLTTYGWDMFVPAGTLSKTFTSFSGFKAWGNAPSQNIELKPHTTYKVVIKYQATKQYSSIGTFTSSSNCAPAPTPITASCVASASSAQTGTNVTFTANVSGGSNYTYSWTGTDGLSGSGSSVTKSYSTAGSKSATVTVTSGSQTVTATCHTTCSTPVVTQPLNGSCDANPGTVNYGDTVTWAAHPTGGSGNYTYAWTGDNALVGTANSITGSYYTAGTKNAQVVISDGKTSITKKCTVTVVAPAPTPITASCVASASSAQTGTNVTFTANVSGGSNYTYSWTGTDSLSGNGSSVTKSYSTAGSKSATVTVTSGSQTVTATCHTTCSTPVVTQPLNGSCDANPGTVNYGDTVTWAAHPTGGSGNYTYAWTGDNALVGTANSITGSYYTAGTKNAQVVISDGKTSITKKCTVTVVAPAPTPITASCVASASSAQTGTNVTFTANVSGGSNYTYSWTGTDSLSGNGSSVTKSYSTAGSKSATVTVTSGSQTVTATCHTTCEVPPPTLVGSCAANTSSISIGNSVTFTASAVGGSGHYTYSWTGDNNLSGSGSSATTQYSTAGTKNAQVVISDGNTSVTHTCSTSVYVPTSGLDGTCYANPSTANIGDTVTWTAYPTDGSGNYTYAWTGSNGLAGSASSITAQYQTAGTQTAQVVISDGNTSVTRTCSMTVNQPQVVNNLAASCSASNSNVQTGTSVTYYANVTGGNGNYTYAWSGSNGIYGNSQSVSQAYTTTGTQYATVAVSSNGQTVNATCNTYVNPPQQVNNLSVSCSASQTSAFVGTTITWYANVYNSNGGYANYSWNGSNGLYSSNQTVSYTYNTPGEQTATVTVNSNGQSISQTCNVYISAAPQTVGFISTPGPTQGAGVYLSQVPYTGFSSNTKVNLFVLALIAWTAGLSYLFIRRKAKKDGLTVSEVISSLNPVSHLAFASAVSASPVHATSVSELPPVQENTMLESLESHARTLRAIVSADGLSLIVNASTSTNEALGNLENVVMRYEGMKKNAEDWTILTTEKISQAFA